MSIQSVGIVRGFEGIHHCYCFGVWDWNGDEVWELKMLSRTGRALVDPSRIALHWRELGLLVLGRKARRIVLIDSKSGRSCNAHMCTSCNAINPSRPNFLVQPATYPSIIWMICNCGTAAGLKPGYVP